MHLHAPKIEIVQLLSALSADGVLQLLDALNMTQPVDILGWSTGELVAGGWRILGAGLPLVSGRPCLGVPCPTPWLLTLAHRLPCSAPAPHLSAGGDISHACTIESCPPTACPALHLTAGGDIGLLLAALHGGRVGRLIGIGAMAGSNHTVLPDLPDVFDPASFANLTQTQQVGGLEMPCTASAALLRGC